MQIEILSEADMADAVTAWTLSRDIGREYDADAIAGVDAPVMEMPSVLLNFNNFMILEREIFCSLRNHVVWARTSRVDDPVAFTVPEEFYIPYHEQYKQSMRNAKAAGTPQDQWRGLLPLVTHTSWTQRISLRDVTKLAMYFGYLASKCNDHNLTARFSSVQFKLVGVVTECVGGRTAHAMFENMKLAKYLHEGRLPQGKDLTRMQYFTTLRATVPIALRAQIIRHRELQFVDDFWSMVNDAPDQLSHLQLQTKVNMQVCARNDIWQVVLGKRACWIAQADIWDPIIKLFGAHPPLPCEDGICPYEEDARARLGTGKDPNPPCPRFCNLYNVPKQPHYLTMLKEAQKRGIFWETQVKQ